MKVTKEMIKPGLFMFKAYILNKGGYIQKMEALGKPFYHHLSPENLFVSVRVEYKGTPGSYITDISLKDAGIIDNNYNQHLTFTEYEEAENYLKEAIYEERLK